MPISPPERDSGPTGGPESGAYRFAVPGVLDVSDLHGNPAAGWVLFIGGNQYMVMPDLLRLFQAQYPECREIFYETLPPGVLAAQLRSGALQVGSLTLRVRPDALTGGKEGVHALIREGWVDAHSARAYATNRLALLVPKGNPAGIRTLEDLAAPGIRVLLPDPEIEGIGRLALEALRRAGGDTLVQMVAGQKRRQGSTRCTKIHHREIPRDLAEGLADAGIVWTSEARYHAGVASPNLEGVAIPEAANVVGEYWAAAVRGADAGRATAWLDFLVGDGAQEVYRRFGFGAPPQTLGVSQGTAA